MPGMKGKINKRKVRQSKPKARKPLKAKSTGSWKKVGAVAVFVVAASVIGAAGGFGARWIHTLMTSSSSFKVKAIEVTGNSRVTREEILDRSGLSEGLNIFTVDIDSEVVHGDFPKRALRAVLEWMDLHKGELLDDWRLAEAKLPLQKIEPLE